ncbi:hypothetical protein CQW23_31869 [Capsicum baccatum]|uniref:Protein kinase domain-containing protein n=1 Tax=Capsicum baccatum TaxID=33114 RepID=A0A2G2V6E3_CAPBA|nr:hypothetical protein CQW23_31869 [Capsicum baccatum]
MDQWMKLFVLGAGSYGKVYYAVKFHSSSIFAEVAAVKCSDISRSSSLKLEAQILTTLKGCPNVVQFFGAALSVDNGIPTYNLFVEYACGGSLHDLIINSKKGMMKMSELEVGIRYGGDNGHGYDFPWRFLGFFSMYVTADCSFVILLLRCWKGRGQLG